MNTTKSRNPLAISLMMAGIIYFTVSNLTFAQTHKSSCCSNGMEKEVAAINDVSGDSTKKMDMKHEMHNHGNMKMEKQQSEENNSIVRKGLIDLKAIDANKDGKVFQDQMDWNVISDKPGKCPLCKMTLKSVTLKEAKENLIKNGFKVK